MCNVFLAWCASLFGFSLSSGFNLKMRFNHSLSFCFRSGMPFVEQTQASCQTSQRLLAVLLFVRTYGLHVWKVVKNNCCCTGNQPRPSGVGVLVCAALFGFSCKGVFVCVCVCHFLAALALSLCMERLRKRLFFSLVLTFSSPPKSSPGLHTSQAQHRAV